MHIVYCRVSTEEQANNKISVTDQKNNGLRYFAAMIESTRLKFCHKWVV